MTSASVFGVSWSDLHEVVLVLLNPSIAIDIGCINRDAIVKVAIGASGKQCKFGRIELRSR
jgi:hypothetical protein